MKEVIAPIVDCLDLEEVNNKASLKELRSQVDKCNKKVLHGMPKLTKFLEDIDKRIEELSELHVEGIDTNEIDEK